MLIYLVTVGTHKILTAQGCYKCAVAVPVGFDLHRGDCGGVAACKLAETTPNAVFRAAAEDLIEQVKAGRLPAPGQQAADEQGEDKGQA